MDLNNRKIKKYPPSPIRNGKESLELKYTIRGMRENIQGRPFKCEHKKCSINKKIMGHKSCAINRIQQIIRAAFN